MILLIISGLNLFLVFIINTLSSDLEGCCDQTIVWSPLIKDNKYFGWNLECLQVVLHTIVLQHLYHLFLDLRIMASFMETNLRIDVSQLVLVRDEDGDDVVSAGVGVGADVLHYGSCFEN